MKPNSAEIIFIIDRSGSMQSIAQDMRGGFANFIAEQRKLPGECRVTLTRFDNVYENVYSGMLISDVPPLELEPRGGTALLDAIGRTITETGARYAAMPESQRPSKVFVVIVTDGHENASREWSHAKVTAAIKHQRTNYAWEFVFMGASEDAIDVGMSMGIAQGAKVKMRTKGGIFAIFNAQSSSIGSSRGGADYNFDQAQYDAALKAEENKS